MDLTTDKAPSSTATTPAVEASLSSWQPGDEGVVTAVPGTSRLLSRLRELGLVPGVRIRVLRTGTSLVIQVGESRFCLRRADAVPIRVSAGEVPAYPQQ